MVALLVSSALVLVCLSPVWWGRVESMVKTSCKLLTNPKKLLPFYAKPPALVNPKDILVGMVARELLRPDIVFLRTPKKSRYEIGCDGCRRHPDGKFEIQWRDRGKASTLGRYADVTLFVMGEPILFSEKALEILKEALERLDVFESERAKLEDEAKEQQKACDLIEKWCGIDSTEKKEV